MKVLLVLSHYYKPQNNGIHSSTNPLFRSARQRALEEVLFCWRSHYGENAILNIEKKKFLINQSSVDQLDIVLLINEDNHLIQPDWIEKYRLKIARVQVKDPRTLPFAAHKVMADLRASYDWFVYSEDDLAVRDGLLFKKLLSFQNKFGSERVLQPHRYELNKNAERFKTYIDGDLRRGFIQPFIERVLDDSSTLVSDVAEPFDGYGIEFIRTLNPHSGFFALTRDQLHNWISQKHFLDLDCSFVSPLESAATLGILKTFSIYKSTAPNLGYLEIEHLDQKFSKLKLGVWQE